MLCRFCSGPVSSNRKYCSDSCMRKMKSRRYYESHKEECKKRNTLWQQENAVKRREIQNDYYARNKAKIAVKIRIRSVRPEVKAQHNAAQHRYYLKHRKEIIAKLKSPEIQAARNIRRREWKKLNPDKVKAKNARQHDRRKFSGMRNFILKRDEYTCQDC